MSSRFVSDEINGFVHVASSTFFTFVPSVAASEFASSTIVRFSKLAVSSHDIMFQKSLLGASPSSFGSSRYDRSPRLSPSFLSSSFDDIVSRRSSLDCPVNNAVSFSSSYSSRPPLYPETGSKNAPTPTIGFAKPPLEETKAPNSTPELFNNVTLGFTRPASPGLLSLTLSEELRPPPHNRNIAEREARLADQFLDDIHQPWNLLKLQADFPVFMHPVVTEAYEVAAKAHAGQLRKSGEPVLSHCAETAKILAALNADSHIIAAALLHDVVDDTCVTCAQLKSWIAADVYDLVEKVSKMSHMSQLVRDGGVSLPNVGKLKDVLIASVDCRAVLIKLADRIHNMRTLSALSHAKQQEWAQETMDLFVPLAGRLGCWAIKSELEDLAFAVLYPEAYHDLKERYDAKVALFNEAHLKGALDKLKMALDAAGIVYEDISGRPKNLYGVFRKIQRKHYESLDQVLDLFALRIVLRDGQSCHKALEVVQHLWQSVPNKLKDYVQHPKPNGYRSIHDVCIVDGVPLEVQIRNTAMHYIAEHGVAAHWRYKEASPDSGAVHEFVEQRTLWSRYVLNSVFELNDKKLRPDALQESSTAVQSIWKSFLSFEDTKPRTIACQHGAKNLGTSWCPVHIVVQDSEGLRVCDAPLCATVESFLLEHGDVLKSDGRVPTVNGNLVPPDTVLQFGDLIEFCNAPAKGHRSIDSMIVPFRRDLKLEHQ